MPELPEVESILRHLAPILIGKTIKNIHIHRPKCFIGDQNKIIGKTISKIFRHGKYLHIQIEPHLYLSVHLKMSGQLLYSESSKGKVFPYPIPRSGTNEIPNKHTRVILVFEDDSALFFNDLRAFGWLKIERDPIHPKGDDILNEGIIFNDLVKKLGKTSRSIKTVLLDQNIIAGLGNIYVNDVLFEAKIHPLTAANRLNGKQIEKLVVAIDKIISLALKYRGSSSGDEMYILPDSTRGDYQKITLVYGREGSPCKKCGQSILRIKQGGRSSFFCPKCQVKPVPK